MIGAVLVTHGGLGDALLEVAALIAGSPVEGITSVSLGPSDSADRQAEQIRAAVGSFEEGCVILTDLFGGTPQNLALTLLEEDRVDVVSGVNLPMLLGLVAARRQHDDVHAIANRLHSVARSSMVVASDTLRRQAEMSRELPAVRS